MGDVVNINARLEETARHLMALLLAAKPEDLTPFGRRFVKRMLSE